MPETRWIVDVDAAAFATAVVERSRSVPVVLDFWATWCGPCKTLGPLLEKLANEEPGRFVLAKVDIDKSPELAQAFRITSVPTVLAVVNGRPLDGFQGALPEADLRRFLEGVAPSRTAQQTDLQAQARELEEAGDLDGAIGLLQEELLHDAPDPGARTQLARLFVERGELDAAKSLLDGLPDEESRSAAARALRSRIAFLEGAGDLDELRRAVERAPESAAARLELGKGLVAVESWASGLEQLLESLRRDPGLEGGAARKKMLEVFELLGLDDPVANEYRFKLSLELFA
jgi:putative thioredoxin